MKSNSDMLPDFFKNRNVLVYDGECPFCSRYAALLRVRATVGELHMINARDQGAEVNWLVRQDYDLDEGMILVLDGVIHHGDEALFVLAQLSTDSDFFNRLNRRLFGLRPVARVLYPLLRMGRNVTLRLLGRSKLYE